MQTVIALCVYFALLLGVVFIARILGRLSIMRLTFTLACCAPLVLIFEGMLILAVYGWVGEVYGVSYQIWHQNADDQLLAAFAEIHVDAERRRDHHRLPRTAVDPPAIDRDVCFTADRDLQQEEILEQLRPDVDARAVAMIDEGHALELGLADEDVEDLFAADDIQPGRSRSRRKSPANAGSPIHPRPRLASVMPSCVAER